MHRSSPPWHPPIGGAIHRAWRSRHPCAGASSRTAEQSLLSDVEIRARRFVIATGSKPALPAIPGPRQRALSHQRKHFRSEGKAGASHHHRRGADWSRIGAGLPPPRKLGDGLEAAQPLGKDDPECAAVVLDQPRARGRCHSQRCECCRYRACRANSDGDNRGSGAEQTITGSHLLVAAGRSPSIEDLDLDTAGIRHEPSGIVVNRKLKTTNRRVYAIGDCMAGALAAFACGQLSCRPGDPERLIPPAGAGQQDCSAVGQLIRNRNSPRPGSPKRRRGSMASRSASRAGLITTMTARRPNAIHAVILKSSRQRKVR